MNKYSFTCSHGYLLEGFCSHTRDGKEVHVNNEDQCVNKHVKKLEPTRKKVKKCSVFKHDFKHLIRKGRADYRCPKCKKNVVLLLVLARQAGIDLRK